jgi:hypothetical protein
LRSTRGSTLQRRLNLRAATRMQSRGSLTSHERLPVRSGSSAENIGINLPVLSAQRPGYARVLRGDRCSATLSHSRYALSKG